MTCEHRRFETEAHIFRLSDKDEGPITGYSTHIHIHCAECGVAFRFIGLPFGSSPSEPRLSVDSQELRAPIEPAYVTEILGEPLVKGAA